MRRFRLSSKDGAVSASMPLQKQKLVHRAAVHARCFVLLLAFTAGHAITASAQAQMPTGTPPPPAAKLDVEPFRFLLGHWQGKGTFTMSGETVASSLTFEVENRTTLSVRYAEDAPNTYRFAALWSREKGSDDLLMLMSSSLDGPALLRSTGWQNSRLVFEPKSALNTGGSVARLTFEKKSASELAYSYEFLANGTWYMGDRQTFTKVN